MICETKIRVIFADTDAMGIVYNGTYLSYFERGRIELLRAAGVPWQVWVDNGLTLPVATAHVDYKSPAYADDMLIIKTRIEDLKGASARMSYEVFDETRGYICVTGYTVHPVTDGTLRPVRFKKNFPEMYQKCKEYMERGEE